MKDIDTILLERAYIQCENTKQAKQLVQAGKLSQEDLNAIKSIDPSKTNKYTGWMAKQWAQGNIDNIDVLRNTIEEFDVFNDRRKTKHPDIFQYKTFDEVKADVDTLNQTGAGMSNKELEEDYEVIVDNEDLLICVPHTHEASRKLGLTHFIFRDCGEGQKDSSWCTTFKTPNHFNDYYYSSNVTFYYVKVRSKELQNKLEKQGFGPQHFVTALCIFEDGQIDTYDGNDNTFNHMSDAYLDILGLSK